MPIKNYDDPFPEAERDPPDQDIFKTIERLIKSGAIPAQGKTAFTFELVQSIIKTWWNVVKSHASWRGRLLKKTGDYLDTAFKLYTAYAQRLDKEVEITPELINEMTGDFVLFIMGGIADFLLHSKDPRAVKLQPRPSVKYWMESIKADQEGDHDKALEYLDKAVEMRVDIEPLFNRGNFRMWHKEYSKARADFTLAIKEAIPGEPNQGQAYAKRGLCYHREKLTDKCIADLVCAFELFEPYIQKLPPAKDPDHIDEVASHIDYFVGECVPVVKSIDKQSTSLSADNRQKLERIKDLILSIRQKTGE